MPALGGPRSGISSPLQGGPLKTLVEVRSVRVRALACARVCVRACARLVILLVKNFVNTFVGKSSPLAKLELVRLPAGSRLLKVRDSDRQVRDSDRAVRKNA